jgi:hypothetical protein
MGSFVAWLFGPVPLLFVSVATVFFLHHLDHFSGLTLPEDMPVTIPEVEEGRNEDHYPTALSDCSPVGSTHIPLGGLQLQSVLV